MDRHDNLAASLTPLTRCSGAAGAAWYVGGSVASTVHGRFRATNDVDVIADLREEHARSLRVARRRTTTSTRSQFVTPCGVDRARISR